MKSKDIFKEQITWKATGIAEYPFGAMHKNLRIWIRINDFPAEHLYTVIGTKAKIDFDEWPEVWSKSSSRPLRKPAAATTALREQLAQL